MSIVVNVNMSKEVFDYFRNYDKSKVANTLLEMYDFTNLPAVEGARARECKVTIENETFISLYKTLGPRNKKVSLARLFEFAYNMDVLCMPRFKEMQVVLQEKPTYTLIDRAYRALLEAQKYDNSPELKEISHLVYEYRSIAYEQNN